MPALRRPAASMSAGVSASRPAASRSSTTTSGAAGAPSTSRIRLGTCSRSPTPTSGRSRAEASPARTSGGSALLVLRPGDRALEFGLAHLRASRDVELASLRLELTPGGLVPAPDRGRLLAKRRAGLRRQVLQRLLILCGTLRLAHVALGRGSLLLCRRIDQCSSVSALREGHVPTDDRR